MASQEVTEACLESKEPTSVEAESITVHEEFHKEETAVRTVRALTIPVPPRDTVIGDQAGTVLQEEPLKDRCSRRDNGCARKAAVE
jgi:hypothetical protein